MTEKYEIRRFRAAQKGEPDYALGVSWLRGVGVGFYDERHKDEFVDKVMAMYRADNRELTGVYQCGTVAAHSLAADIPVATCGTLRKNLNVGYGRQLEAQLITAVTVRGTHRRQGLLRRMMTEDLAASKADGLAIAALTASEASIYGRFGFGVATFERSVKVDTGPRFRLRHSASGSVEVADRKVLLELAQGVFERVHRVTPGSIDRQDAYRQRSSGTLGRDGAEDESIRCALHYDADGAVDGYVAYKFSGWDTTPATMEVVDLVAATTSGYLELWQFLGSIDLIQRVAWAEAPVDDPLTWALEDPRCIESAENADMLWLRILDTAKALGARRYSTDGSLVLHVTDTLGFAAGTYTLTVTDGEARVESAPDGTEPDLSLDVAELGSVFLGAVCPVTLAAAGRILEHVSGAALTARLMFAVDRAPHCLTHF
ncbi:GNAT family N-acetyltransferase [Pseudarthrobacter sp. PH31-O2]|uniref:GNAT family N-acetyltransferase n=1 Tax=Pseudarthrobacter sp. PH31-O2 TaxID=3046206 RepID=UPI0024B96679|nr:GNAT family N-acetyltransferase [Pseudarthrobacter sp. PH31-O2]MDJ0351824.1 GNAT family N-acetyltransferase [Pseudarthrobacter sp. PH31-O2]